MSKTEVRVFSDKTPEPNIEFDFVSLRCLCLVVQGPRPVKCMRTRFYSSSFRTMILLDLLWSAIFVIFMPGQSQDRTA